MGSRTIDELAAEVQRHIEQNNAEALEQCLLELEPFGLTQPLASASHILGLLLSQRGHPVNALVHYQRALAAHLALGDHANAATITCNIGFDYETLGQYSDALEYFNRALSLHEQHGPPAGVANATLGLGNIAAATGDYPEALKQFHRALELAESIGNRASLPDIHTNIGNIYSDTDTYTKALEYHRKALELYQELGDQRGIARVTGNIGVVHWKTGNFPDARDQFTRTVEIYRSLNDRGGVTFVTGNLLTVAIDMGDLDRASELLALMDAEPLADVHVVVQRERSRAQIQELSGDLDAAHQTLLSALAIARERSLATAQADVHKRLRDLALKRNDLADYVEHNNEFTRITDEVNGKETATRLAMQEAQRQIDLERKEHERHLAVLHATLPKAIADRVARGETVSDHFDAAAVLFTDIVGFTSHSSELPGQVVTALLEELYRAFDLVCRQHGVTKVKTIGDAYLCFKGDGNAEENAAALANAAAAFLHTGLTWPSGEPLVIRVGIHIGPVTAGVIGTERLQYDIWGDTVNTASRMESNALPGTVNLSAAMANGLRGNPEFTLESRGMIEVKGKGAMEMFLLRAVGS